MAPARRSTRYERDDDSGIISVVEGPNGRIYGECGQGPPLLTRQGDGRSGRRQLFSRFGAIPTGFVYVEPNDIAWFGWKQQLVRFDMKKAAAAMPPFRVLVRRVTVDRTVCSMGAADSRFAAAALGPETLRFEYAAPTFIDETATQYQTKLDGLDVDWTNWTSESRRDFTNLTFGDYRFHVRARNVTGAMGDEATYVFTIQAPWYRTWWAYLGYLLAAGLVLSGASRLLRGRVVAKERERSQIRRDPPAGRGGRGSRQVRR